jgi:hypothetical protein
MRARVSALMIPTMYVTLGLLLLGCTTLFPPPPQVVSFQSVPPGAEVFVDGVSLGVTPLAHPLRCSPAPEVRMTHAGYASYTQPLATVSGVDRFLSVTWPVQHCQTPLLVVLRPQAR